MMVSFDYSDEIRKAYEAGAAAGMAYALRLKKAERPSADAYLEQLRKQPIVARL